MKDYPFDKRFFAIVEEWDMGWRCVMSQDPLTTNGVISDFENLGYSRIQLKDQLDSVKNWSPHDLAEKAIADNSDDCPALAVLQNSNSREVFDYARLLCQSEDQRARALGVLVIMRTPGLTFHEEAVETICKLAERETHPKVLEALAYSLHHLDIEKRAEYLRRAVKSEDAGTRHAAAYSLGGLDGDEAIEQLMLLSKDTDGDVRNWATFGLGTMTDRDTPELRDALFLRLEDTHDECRHEAILGLAIRKDTRVKPSLLKALSSDDVWVIAVEAAKELGDPDFYQILLTFVGADSDSNLQQAIESCRANETGSDVSNHS